MSLNISLRHSRSLKIIQNYALEKGMIPYYFCCNYVYISWRFSEIVTPIFKSGSKSKTSNYRPVSLTSQICKIFEAIIRDKMVEFLETHGSIKDSQHGFRRGRSCLTNLLCFLDKVTSCLDDKDCMDIVFLDLAKAFDKVPHRRFFFFFFFQLMCDLDKSRTSAQ